MKGSHGNLESPHLDKKAEAFSVIFINSLMIRVVSKTEDREKIICTCSNTYNFYNSLNQYGTIDA